MSYQPSSSGVTPVMTNRFRKPITWGNVNDPANDTWKQASAAAIPQSGVVTDPQYTPQSDAASTASAYGDSPLDQFIPSLPDVRSRYNLDGGSDSPSWFEQAQQDAHSRVSGVTMPQGNAQQRWSAPTSDQQTSRFYSRKDNRDSKDPETRREARRFSSKPMNESDWSAY